MGLWEILFIIGGVAAICAVAAVVILYPFYYREGEDDSDHGYF